MKLIIQIPCYNEEESLADVIADLPKELPGVDEIEYLVIDDGCTDRTVEVAKEAGVHHVLSLPTNKGLAVAFLEGLRRCVELGADVIVNTDGDHQYPGQYVPDLIQPILDRKAELVIGSRPIEEIEYFSWLKKRLQRIGSYVVRKCSGTDIPDTTSGYRAYSADAAMKLHVFNPYDYALETIIQAGHMGIKLAHVPITVNPKTRESRLFPSYGYYVRQSAPIILRAYATYKPFRTFFMLGAVTGIAGFAICLRFLYYYFIDSGSGFVQSLILGAILLILSFNLFMLAILSDVVTANRKLMQQALFEIRKNKQKE
ncbi:MAG: glycosyltransferase family 2 protein [Planctomycetota bacterium]|jgi:glycosyltransferase involved in cell wall biosynthesis